MKNGCLNFSSEPYRPSTSCLEILFRVHCHSYHRVLCIWFLFVETKGPTLEEIARLFDGASANVSGKQVIEKKSELTGAALIEHAEES